MAGRRRASPHCIWRGSPPTVCSSRSSLRSICAYSTRCATSSITAREKFKAKRRRRRRLLNVNTGEIVAMVSEPDFDPNNPREANDPTRLNRLTTGVYEMGSTFKVLTLAMALDCGKVTLTSTFDARVPLRYGQFDDPRLPRAEPRALGAGDFHLFVQYRHGAHGARASASRTTRRS